MIDSSQIRAAIDLMSEDDYDFLDLARWAQGAGEIDEDTLSVFVAPAFLFARLGQPDGVFNLESDFDILSTKGTDQDQFRLIGNAIQLASSILSRDPNQLSVQLLARLPQRTDGYIGQLRRNLMQERPDGLSPLRTSLIPAEQAFSVRQISEVELECLECSPDGTLAAVLDARGTLSFVSLSGNRLDVLAAVSCPEAAAISFSPSGNRIFVGARSGQLTTIDSASRTRIAEFRIPHEIHDLCSLDEERLIIQHEEGASVVSASDGHDLKLIGEAEGVDAFTEIAVQRVTGRVLTGDFNGRVDAWSASSGRFDARIGWFGEYQEGWTSRAMVMIQALTRSKSWTASGSTAKPIDFEAMFENRPDLDPKLRRQIQQELRDDPHRHSVTAILADDSGRLVVAASINGELTAWDTSTSKRLGWLEGHVRGLTSLAIASDGDSLISAGDGSVRMWSLSRMSPLGQFVTRRGGPEIVRCPRGKRIVLGADKDGTLTVWNLDAPLRLPESEIDIDPVVELACPLTDGAMWAVSRKGRIEEWALKTASRIRTIQGLDGAGKSARLSAQGRRLVVSNVAGIHVLDVATGLPMFFMPVPGSYEIDGEHGISVSENGERVVLAYAEEPFAALLAGDGRLELLEMASGQRVTLEQSMGLVGKLTVSPDGRFVLVESSRTIASETKASYELWDLDLRKRVVTSLSTNKGLPHCFSFRPDRRTLLWQEGRSVYQLVLSAPASEEQVLEAPSVWRRISFAPDNRYAAVLVGDAHLELWDFQERRQLASFDSDENLTSCAIAAKSGSLLASDVRGGIHVLKLPLPLGNVSDPAHPSADSTLAARIDETVLVERSGRAAEALAGWSKLLSAPDSPTPLRIALARLVHTAGHPGAAEGVLRQVVMNSKGEERRQAIGAMFELGAGQEIASILRSGLGAEDPRDSEVVALLSKAADWLVKQQNETCLEATSRPPAPQVNRLIAAQALAELSESAAIRALEGYVQDQSVPAEFRTVACMSLRALLPALDWMRWVTIEMGTDRWNLRERRRVGGEILRSLNLAIAMHDLLPSFSGKPYLVEPLRSAGEWNQQALALASGNELDAAIAVVDRAIRRKPQATRYYLTRAMIHLGAGRDRRDKRHFPGHFDQGQWHFEKAVEDLTRAIDLDRSNEKAWSQRGYVYLELEQYELAIQDINEAIRLDGSDVANFQNRAFCLRQLSRRDEADADDQRVARIESDEKEGTQSGIPALEVGRLRAGDDPWPSEQEIAALNAAARHALDQLGLTEELREEFATFIRAKMSPESFISEAITMLESLDGEGQLAAIAKDDSVPADRRAAVAILMIRKQTGESGLQTLLGIATNFSLPVEIRAEAADSIAEKWPIESTFTLLRQLRDVDHTQTPVPNGTYLAPRLFRAVRAHPSAQYLTEQLAMDKTVSPALREIAGEALATYFDRTAGYAALEALAKELSLSHPLQAFIQRLPGILMDRDEKKTHPVSIEQIAFDDFVAARSPDDIALLAKTHRVLFDPDFLDQAVSHLEKVPTAERDLYNAKLSRLRALPPDHEVIGFRMFARANSPEAMKEVVERFPFLAVPGYYPTLVRIIEATNPGARPAFERRLGWLRSIRPDPWQEALQAFADAETDEELRHAVERYPNLSRPGFAELAEKALRSYPEWPTFERRLRELRALVPMPEWETVIEAAADALQHGEPEEALAHLEGLQKDPEHQGKWLRALALVSTSRAQEAIEIFDQIIALSPSAIRYAARGRALFNLKHFRRALSDFSDSLKLDPELFEAWLGRGLVHANLQLTRQAIEDLTRAEKLNPEDELIYIVRAAMFLAEGKSDAAVADFRTAIRLLPDSARPRIGLAQALLSSGAAGEAREVLRDARIRASNEELVEITLLEKSAASSSAALLPDDGQRAFETLMAVRSLQELRAAASKLPLLADSAFLEELEQYGKEHLSGDAARALDERLHDLRRIVLNPAQAAFDAVVAANTVDDLRIARSRHALLREPAFLDHLTEFVKQVEPDSTRTRLNVYLAQLKAFILTHPES